MNKLIVGLAVALAFAAADTLSAHGGTYQGPSGGGTPGYSGPTGGGISGGGGGQGGGQTGGPGGGVTGGGGGGGTGGPSGPGLRPTGGRIGGGGAARGGRTTGRMKAKSTDRTSDWDWWWELNDDPFLNLRRKVRQEESSSENMDTFLGSKMGDDVAGLTLRTIRSEILPALKAACKDEFFDARSGAVIALGKIADADDPAIIDDIKAVLKDENNTVREAACLGLALLGTKDVVPMLFDIAEATPKGKKLVGRADVLNRTRAFATCAIGLVGLRDGFSDDEDVIHRLVKMAAVKGATSNEMQVAPALALGLIKNQAGVPGMEGIFKNLEADEYTRSHIAVALGKVGATSSLRYLVKGLTDKSTHVRRGSAIGLGQITSVDDKATIRELMGHAKSASDRSTKNFCLISLGQIGSPEAIAFLAERVMRGQVHDKTFAALGLGVAAFNGREIDDRIVDLVMKTYTKCKSKSEKGAYAISLALMGHEEAKPELRKAFEEAGAQDLKGHVCTALGLLEDKEAIPQIRELVAQRGDTDLRKRAAIALGLLRDPGAVETLKKVIEESGNSKAILGAATVALGWIGDKRAVPILVEFLSKKQGIYQAQDVTRAFATVALGFLGDKDDIPLLSYLQRNSNFLAQTAALAEMLTIL